MFADRSETSEFGLTKDRPRWGEGHRAMDSEPSCSLGKTFINRRRPAGGTHAEVRRKGFTRAQL